MGTFDPPHRIPKRIKISDAEVDAAMNMLRWYMDQECWSDIKPAWTRDVLAVALAVRQAKEKLEGKRSRRPSPTS